ncbi:MAG: ATP synthase subunit a [Parcubacteria group bacterium GW2011_GWB1_44_7]|nr:MAG: ATP synthase subunit a [Parcubacteria group bacterium GW2011_GWB1_44_7]
MIPISIKAEIIADIADFPITNTLLASWLAMLVLIAVAFIFSKTLKEIPGKFQNAVETVVEAVLDFMSTIAGNRETAIKFFPIVATIFLFVLIANWMGILPGFGSIGLFQNRGGEIEFIPLLRSANADLAMTLALALIVVVMSQIVGIISLGVKHHFGKFISFKSPVTFFVGALEIVSEFAKILSFSFRLFGNVFAGEVLLIIIAFLVPYIIPMPFLALELFVGLIQALIFAVLAMIFLTSATQKSAH